MFLAGFWGCWGCVLLYLFWFGKRVDISGDLFICLGLPPFPMFALFLVAIVTVYVAAITSFRPITRIALGFPPFVLDREERVFREANHVLFDLEGGGVR